MYLVKISKTVINLILKFKLFLSIIILKIKKNNVFRPPPPHKKINHELFLSYFWCLSTLLSIEYPYLSFLRAFSLFKIANKLLSTYNSNFSAIYLLEHMCAKDLKRS